MRLKLRAESSRALPAATGIQVPIRFRLIFPFYEAFSTLAIHGAKKLIRIRP
jgi:hypothetical protein